MTTQLLWLWRDRGRQCWMRQTLSPITETKLYHEAGLGYYVITRGRIISVRPVPRLAWDWFVALAVPPSNLRRLVLAAHRLTGDSRQRKG